MDRNYLIENCYNNKYNIDLLGMHINSSQYSKYDKPTSIFDEKFDRNNLNFYDGISTHFELVYHYDLLYLLGDKSCYPCGKIVEGAYEINWVPIFVIPTGSPIKVFSDIRKSCCVNWSGPINKYHKMIPIEDFQNYIQDYIGSFSNNEWFSNYSIRNLIKTFVLNPVEKTCQELRKRKLLNPFELALAAIVFDFGITCEEITNCLNYGNGVSFPHEFLRNVKTGFSLAESTSKLVNGKYFEIFVASMAINDIEGFFEIEYLHDLLKLENFYPELMLDVLQISIYERYGNENGYTLPKDVDMKLQRKLNSVNITESTVKEYYRRIKSNIRSIENQVRKNSGYREVGTVYNEILIFNYFKENFKDHDILYQYKPAWLGRQIFDVYFKSLNVAIEYNGKQHYQPIEFYGGDKGFENLVRLDTLKRKKCLENNCILFEIKYDEDINLALSNISDKINSLN